MKTETRYQRTSGIVRREVGADVLLLDPSNDALHVLNTAAAFVWDELAASASIAELAVALNEAFEVDDAADLTVDLRRVLADLTQRGLIAESDG